MGLPFFLQGVVILEEEFLLLAVHLEANIKLGLLQELFLDAQLTEEAHHIAAKSHSRA